MRSTILSYEETRRNARLKELHAKKVNSLLVSGSTGELESWKIEDLFTKVDSKKNDIERMIQYDLDNKIGSRCDGLTYLEIEQFNNTYNNFR
jgi:hypothetical protein